MRLLDCINKPKDLIDRAIELGLSGIAITDHEILSSHVEVNQYMKELQKTNPDFTIALGNEIYLVEDRSMGQKYFHFILIAKDEIGHRALRELSSIAWYNAYSDRGIERVPTLKSELSEIMAKYKGHVIGTTACIGGELSTMLLVKTQAEKRQKPPEVISLINHHIADFIKYCVDTFGKENFFIECAPSTEKTQIIANKRLLKVARLYGVRLVTATDSHYLSKETRFAHKAYLNSKNGEREVDDFYQFARLMDQEEVAELLEYSFEDRETIEWIFENTEYMRQQISSYSLQKHPKIPEVDVKDYPKLAWWGVNNSDADEMTKYPTLKDMFVSEDKIERYWVNQCWESLKEKGIDWTGPGSKYVERLEEEAKTKKILSGKLNTNMFQYPVTLQHYINLFWECGSTVGAGRGSSCSGLNHWLLGITQLDPLKWNLPWFRYMNEERTELGCLRLILPSCKKIT